MSTCYASRLWWTMSYVLSHILIWKAARLRAYKGNVEKRKWGQWGGGIKRTNEKRKQRQIQGRSRYRGKEQEGKWKGMGIQQFWFWREGRRRHWAIFMDLRTADLHVSRLFAYQGQKVPTPRVRRNRNSVMQPSGKLFKLLASDLPTLEEGKWRGRPVPPGVCAKWGSLGSVSTCRTPAPCPPYCMSLEGEWASHYVLVLPRPRGR